MRPYSFGASLILLKALHHTQVLILRKTSMKRLLQILAGPNKLSKGKEVKHNSLWVETSESEVMSCYL